MEILTYDELLATAQAAVSLGIRKVRVTGGEPLVRRGVIGFLGRLSRIPGIAELCMTTNGVGLRALAIPLKEAGLSRVNVSIDTVRRDRYREITRRDHLPDVLAGIDAAIRAGLSPVKINVVLLHGLLPGEVDEFFDLARELPVEVRFIERMPVGCVPSDGYVSADGVRRRLLSLPGVRVAEMSGPSAAVAYEIPGYRGRLGTISPFSRGFCDDCNRLRVTADGRLLGCLFGHNGLDLRKSLREGGSPGAVAALIRKAVSEKPERHALCAPGRPASLSEPMSRVGG